MSGNLDYLVCITHIYLSKSNINKTSLIEIYENSIKYKQQIKNLSPSSSSHSKSSEVPSSLVERVLVVKSQLYSVLGVNAFVSEGSPANTQATLKCCVSFLKSTESWNRDKNFSLTQSFCTFGVWIDWNMSLTVAPEGIWLSFNILEVDVEILPRVLPVKWQVDNYHEMTGSNRQLAVNGNVCVEVKSVNVD